MLRLLVGRHSTSFSTALVAFVGAVRLPGDVTAGRLRYGIEFLVAGTALAGSPDLWLLWLGHEVSFLGRAAKVPLPGHLASKLAHLRVLIDGVRVAVLDRPPRRSGGSV
ncbi:hypothetical protein [Nonomuraea recticatena]|uniref:hypothetical protein n=1 Tax=Nonomuraea recticatena TaxID=46178 RepID=UPI0031F7A340